MAFDFNMTLTITKYIFFFFLKGGTLGQSDGDQARHVAAAVLFIMAPLSILTLPLIFLVVRLHAHVMQLTQFDFIWIWILLLVTLTQTYIHVCKVWLMGKRSLDRNNLDVDMTSAGRRILFKQLVVTSLDILGRILRHKSFAQCVTRVVIVQCAFIMAWSNALFHLLYNDSTRNNYFLIFIAISMGLWGTAILRRILGYIASGGVTLWLDAQHHAALAREKKQGRSEQDATVVEDSSASSHVLQSFPRSSYSENPYGVLPVDDDELDDESDDNEESMEHEKDLATDGCHSPSSIQYGHDSYDSEKSSSWFDPVLGLSDLSSSIGLPRNITLRTLFYGAVCLSLGSIASCAASAAVSLWMLQVLSWIDYKRCSRGQQERRDSSKENFRPMTMGHDSPTQTSLLSKVETVARFMSRYYSDCGLGHVAAYVKSYRTASCDVMNRLVETGKTAFVSLLHVFF